MLVRTFALWTALGVSVAGGSALLLPVTSDPAKAIVADGPTGPALHPFLADHAQFTDGKALLLDGRLGHASVPRDPSRPASTFVLATVTAVEPASDDRVAPPPVHLALVVDRSGSMAGLKMSNAIAAAVGAVERMRDGDRVTVVAFDASAMVLVPPTTLDAASRPSVEASIRAMRVGGDTCLSCALDRSTEALEAAPGVRDEIKRILLISDGEATTGIRDVNGLRRLAASARDRGFGVSTIGVDLAFDEKVMAAVAQEGGGRHWFVPDPTALGQVFDQELGSLESAVATEAELSIEPAPGVVVDEVFDRSFRREGTRILVPLGAFDARQDKTVLLGVHVPADGDANVPVAHLSLSYRDVLARKDGRCAGDLALELRDDGTAQREIDPFVATRVERSRTAHALLDANELFARGRSTEARAALARRQGELALAAPKAASNANGLSPAASAGAGDLGKDFGAQEQALAHAQSGFGAAVAASPPGAPAPPTTTPAARAALKTNQANATDLAF